MVVKGCSCGGASLYTLCGTQRGAGFDGAQVTSFLRVCHHLSPWEEICGARDKAICDAQTSILSGLLSHIGDRVGSQVSGAEALIVRPELAVFPLSVCPPFSHHCNPCHRGTRGACTHWKKRSQTTGWLLTEVQATSNVPPVPAPAVASPTLHKRSFWYETPWSVTADHFSQPLLSLSC